MDRLLVLAVVAALAGLVAVLLPRWRPGGPVATGWSVPGHLERAAFAKPAVPWLVAVFSSTDCAACALVVTEAYSLASALVVVQEVPAESAGDLHDRYEIDAVPMLVVADEDGLVRAHHLGPSAPGELQAVLEGARSSHSVDEPGATCLTARRRGGRPFRRSPRRRPRSGRRHRCGVGRRRRERWLRDEGWPRRPLG